MAESLQITQAEAEERGKEAALLHVQVAEVKASVEELKLALEEKEKEKEAAKKEAEQLRQKMSMLGAAFQSINGVSGST